MLSSIKQTKISTAIHYAHTHAETESFLLSDLARDKLLAPDVTLESFQQATGLADFYWETTYYQHPYHRRSLPQALAEAEGYMFFLHGWTGSRRIWEKLPIQLAVKNRQLVCFNLDVNGFGDSPFLAETPSPEQCSPSALITAVDQWLQAVNLWPSQAVSEKKPFYLFIGHSMSGAAFFYKDNTGWENENYGFYALAPALFCNDSQRRAFFKAMGLVGVNLPPSLNAIKNSLAPHVIEILGNGASQVVKNEHLRIYSQTSFGTIAQVIYTLGVSADMPHRTDWSRFRVALGHKDKVVNLTNTLDLLDELDFSSDQIKVMLGDHYFFSHGEDSPLGHQQNRQFLIDDIQLFCQQLAPKVAKVGQKLYNNQQYP
ncbi:MAG: hypothetical protein KDI79_04515 [Anaerolineae bacterium]|nr:hypothetical protein [Anaerolineae bacterium]